VKCDRNTRVKCDRGQGTQGDLAHFLRVSGRCAESREASVKADKQWKTSDSHPDFGRGRAIGVAVFASPPKTRDRKISTLTSARTVRTTRWISPFGAQNLLPFPDVLGPLSHPADHALQGDARSLRTSFTPSPGLFLLKFGGRSLRNHSFFSGLLAWIYWDEGSLNLRRYRGKKRFWPKFVPVHLRGLWDESHQRHCCTPTVLRGLKP
jgi:hypothetical protein